MNTDTETQNSKFKIQNSKSKHVQRLKVAAVLFTVLGIALFAYFVATVGFYEIMQGVGRIGFDGFAAILIIYLLRICVRATAWKLSVYAPYKLEIRDTVPAVIIGEAMSSIIPLGILISGTAKAVAVRKKVPLVVGLSSVATENLFYSLVTSLFIVLGGVAFLRSFELAEGWRIGIDVLIAGIFALIALGAVMILRQWHFASELCEKIYQKGYLVSVLEKGRMHVRLFENLIYGFYRKYPRRFLPIVLLEVIFHALGVLEVWFIMSRISTALPTVFTAFLLESISRVITTLFKLIPFLIGVDEAGAQFVTETLALGVGVGVTLAIIRKGRILFWAIVGVLLIVKRGLSLREFTKAGDAEDEKGY
ncbi:MAG TPA: lysylphosphatidylglycerol synthase transmembrane domain-containing protein [Pyrinomonadaceae bacterium]